MEKKGQKSTVVKKKNNRSLFYRISAWLHLWLGLVTGIVVVVVCLTGCIWCFNDEITNMLEPENSIAVEHSPIITPSQIANIVETKYPKMKLSSYNVRDGQVLYANLSSKTEKPGPRRRGGGGIQLKINPYSGKIVKEVIIKKGETPFFRWILNGHRALWLPYNIGRPIINYCVLTFVIILISGLVLWWPKKWNKSTRDRCFKIKWNGTIKRINYDMHNVFGFYAMIVLLAIAMTGIVWGIEWFSKSTYWATTGGKTLKRDKRVESDSTQLGKFYTPIQATDLAWERVLTKEQNSKGYYVSMPDTSDAKSTFSIISYPSKGKFYDMRNYTFDQHSLKLLQISGVYGINYQKGNFGEKLRTMNYDIHVGSIMGLTGKFIAFFASLIGASLPITGFIIWFGKKKKSKKPQKNLKATTKTVSVKETVLNT